MGVLVPKSGLDTLFIPSDRSERPRPGETAIVSQSGAITVSSMEKARASGLGVSVCIGLGNKADITENEVLDVLNDDPDTRCIALYLESFSDGRRFTSIAGRISPTKPIVLLKSGRTRSGARAAASHTGALAASSDSLVDGALAQAGVLRAYDEEELIDVAKALSLVGELNGDRICVVASAGGYGVIASDFVESDEHGVSMRMAELSAETRAALERLVPGYTSVTNPVDLTAQVTDEMYDSVLGVLQSDPNIDCILMSLELQPPNVTLRLLDVARERSLSGKKPIVVSVFAGDRTDEVVKRFGEQRVLAYPTIWRSIRAVDALARRGAYLRRLK
jgi:acyl-CoA synthetase (NDP forming)